MPREQNTVSRLYRRLLNLYPRAFRDRLGESMQQTFDDLYNERQRQTKMGVFGFVLWMFLDTVVAILRERLQLMAKGEIMHITFKNVASSALLGLLLILPLMTMQFVNRRNLNEEFPFMLFLGMWLGLFAISLNLLPIVRAWRTGNPDLPNRVVTQRNALLTTPRSTAVISILLLLSTVLGVTLRNLEWEPLRRLFNGPTPDVDYLPGQIISFCLGLLPVAAGIIAGGPIVNTLRAGGKLFAHPFHLIIVFTLSLFFSVGFVFMLVDQWPCFLGVPNCD
jgi:hypothetical protein